MCRTADRPGTVAPSPDLLLVLLEVARSGRYTSAGESLALNNSTVARTMMVGAQIADLLRQVGPDGSTSRPSPRCVATTPTWLWKSSP